MMTQLDFYDLLENSLPTKAEPELWTPEEIFRGLSADTLPSFREDYRLEFKSARADVRDVAAEICAFANQRPQGGVMVIGVEDGLEITGFEGFGTDQASKFEGRYANCPDAQFDHRRISVRNAKGNNDFIVAIHVQARMDRLVETTDGKAYVREGKSKRALTEVEKREVRINLGEVDYERDPVALPYPDEFDTKLIELFVRNYCEKRRIKEIPQNEDVLVWNKLGKMSGGGFRPNLACALLFANEPREICPGARIRFQKFSGSVEGTGSNYNLVTDEWVDGPLPKLIDQASRIVLSNMRNFTRLGMDGRFVTRPEYPRDACIETIVNACVHRSYNFRNMNIFIKMFDDRFVVESPGGFPPPTNAENIYNSHNPRNPYAMEALYYFGYVKCAREGARRIRDEMAGVDLPPPDFAQKEIGNTQVWVTLRNNYPARQTFVDEAAAKVLGSALMETLSDREKLVVNVIAERGRANVSDAVRFLQCDWRTAKNLMEKLVVRKVLERVSSGKSRDSKAFYRLMGIHDE